MFLGRGPQQAGYYNLEAPMMIVLCTRRPYIVFGTQLMFGCLVELGLKKCEMNNEIMQVARQRCSALSHLRFTMKRSNIGRHRQVRFDRSLLNSILHVAPEKALLESALWMSQGFG